MSLVYLVNSPLIWIHQDYRLLRDKSGSCSVRDCSVPVCHLRAAFTPSLGGTLLVLARRPCEQNAECGQRLEVNREHRDSGVIACVWPRCGVTGNAAAFRPGCAERGHAEFTALHWSTHLMDPAFPSMRYRRPGLVVTVYKKNLYIKFLYIYIYIYVCVCVCVCVCVTLDHRTSHKGQFYEIEISTSSESWINNLSIDVWFVMIGQYLAEIWNLRVQKNHNIEHSPIIAEERRDFITVHPVAGHVVTMENSCLLTVIWEECLIKMKGYLII